MLEGKTLRSLVRWLTLAPALLVTAVSAASDEPAADNDFDGPHWAQHLQHHTTGTVSRATPIRLVFQYAIGRANGDPGVPEDALRIKPDVAGSLHLVSGNQLVFQPSNGLTPGQDYSLRLDPSALSGVPAGLGPYRFEVSVVEPAFAVSVDSPRLTPTETGVRVSGRLTTSDRIAPETARAMGEARYRGQAVDLDWHHSESGRMHRFTIDGLRRQAQPEPLTLAWTGEPMGASRQTERTVTIPGRRGFELTEMSIEREGRRRIRLTFSQELDASQDLSGLFTLDGAELDARVSGNTVTLFVTDVGDEQGGYRGELRIARGLRSAQGKRLSTGYQREVGFDHRDPAVRFAGNGVILPAGEHLEVPIETLNVDSLQVTAMRVYADNMGQFLQVSDLDADDSMHRVGRHLWRRTIELPETAPNAWQRYSLDVSELANRYPDALFRLKLSINRANSTYPCQDDDTDQPLWQEGPVTNYEGEGAVNEHSHWDDAEQAYGAGSQGSSYRDRRDPCKNAYYRHASGARAERNFLASNIGLIAKRGNDGSFLVTATDLRSGEALADTRIEVRNYQGGTITTLTTDDQGMVRTQLEAQPYYLVARHAGRRGYLKVDPDKALPTSHLDTGGVTVDEGVKGTIYGERGVWRPGDTMHLTFALHDLQGVIPDRHPATLQLVGPQGQIRRTRTNKDPVAGFYRFSLASASDAPTGRWTARVLVGDKAFERTVRVEAIRPNRLSVELSPESEPLVLDDKPLAFDLEARWLHGATADGLKADVEVRYSNASTDFDRLSDYRFNDPVRSFTSQPHKIWEGELDDTGAADFRRALQIPGSPAGALTAAFTSRVFEPSGAFSVSTRRVPLHPYPRYVGVRLPEGGSARGMLLTDKTHEAAIGTLTHKGEPVDVAKVEVSLYRLDWKWWWDNTAKTVTEYNSTQHLERVQQETIATRDGRGAYEFEIPRRHWGRYLLRACDAEGGHCTGQIFYADWPGWAGEPQGETDAPNVLTITADRDRYEVGETAVLTLPAGLAGRGLLTIEDGSGIINQRWLRFDGDGRQRVRVPIRQGMAPNVYAAITALQSHADRGNDRPLRMQGVVPLMVTDPSTELVPEIATEGPWPPQSRQQVRISEANDKPMTYTLAVVDQGLLGITNFDTPALHDRFYQREALGVLTWDLFDQVVGAYDADLERLLAVGGSDSAEGQGEQQRERRFPPVVRFKGPFKLAAGETREHTVELPQYIGEVRLMAVAGRDGAYGSADKQVAVRDAVSTTVTLPRVLGPGERVTVPVQVFAHEPGVTAASIRLELGDGLSHTGDAQRVVTFGEETERMVRFPVQVAEQVGDTQVTAVVKSNKGSSRTSTDLAIRAPSPLQTHAITKRLAPGERWEQPVTAVGLPGTNEAQLAISSVPAFGLTKRLEHLVGYPYGCLEQTTSSAFPQIYLPGLTDLGEERTQAVEGNVQAGIERLRRFQRPDGGFAYWPGSSDTNRWADVYAGNFLVAAKQAGYSIPGTLATDWIDHAVEASADWRNGSVDDAKTQAFRLLVLARADEPQIGAMNRLRSGSELPQAAQWLLASAYANVGLSDAANELVAADARVDTDYDRPGRTFGSSLRDRAILLDTLAQLGRHEAAREIADRIAATLRGDDWHSTQSVGFALASLGRYYGVSTSSDEPMRYALAQGSQALVTEETAAPVITRSLEVGTEVPVTVRNDSKRTLHATLTRRGKPAPGDEAASQNGLTLDVDYLDTNGEPLDITQLRSGTDIRARVQVANVSGAPAENLALRHAVPSGWEIQKGRLRGGTNGSEAAFTYRDVRDDRVHTHFDLDAGEERTFELRFTAAYSGRYYAPGVLVEAMYEHRLQAKTEGQWVRVHAVD